MFFFLNDRSQKKLSRLHVTYEGTIEGNGQGMLQVSAYTSKSGFISCFCHIFTVCQFKIVYPQLTYVTKRYACK